MSDLLLGLKNATALVCAVAILLCGTLAFAQETQQSQEVSAVSAEPSINYTTESLEDAPGASIPGDFVVGPGKAELVIEPGQSKTVELIVTNRTGETRTFNFETEDTAGSSDPATPIVLLGEERGPYTLRDYIIIPDFSIELEHNERARVPVIVSIPPDAEPGGRYGTVLVTTATKGTPEMPESGAAPSSAIVTRLGTLFFVTVPGDVTREGALQGFATVPDKKFFTEGPVHFQILYENTGDIHLNPYGEIRITNLFNEEVGFVELEPWFAMPKSLRAREISWNRELLIGRYTATVHLNRGYDDIIDTETVTFWVLPWKVVLPIFLGLFLLFFLIRFVAKNFEFKRKSS